MSLLSHLPPPDGDDGKPSYRQKPRPIGFDLSFKLDGDVLEIDSTRKVDRVRLTHVEQVRFTFKPGNIATTGYVTKIRLTDGKVVTIGDTSWRSMVEVERGGERYVRFIRALCEAIRQANPKARFVAGKPRAIWLVFAITAAIAIAVMGMFTLGALTGGHMGAFWLGLFIVLVASWQAIPLVWLNRPMDLPSGEPPEHLLPRPDKI